jgi:hypothetical protein
MNLKNIIAVSGIPGLLELVSSKSNGLLLMDPIKKTTKFYSIRLHQFTPLETIAIYTMTDTVELKDVFLKMMENEPVGLNTKSTNAELMSYMETLLPEYDRDKVFPRDVKKLVKWYEFSKEMGYLNRTEEQSAITDEIQTLEDSNLNENIEDKQ